MILKILIICVCLIGCILATDDEITSFMKDNEVIPDVLTEAPAEWLKIDYENGLVGEKGVELTPTSSKNPPTLDWTTEPDTYYTMLMVNPDIPSRTEPKWREFIHWLIVNIPGKDLSQGELLSPYFGPAAPKTSGLLRYVFLIYKQPGKLDFEEKPLNNTSVEGHHNFSSMIFSEKYGMGPPVAGNMFQARWDDYVPVLHKMFNVGL